MSNLNFHPPAEELAEFALGRGGAEIESHISVCNTCCQLLTTIPDDSLTSRLRTLKVGLAQRHSDVDGVEAGTDIPQPVMSDVGSAGADSEVDSFPATLVSHPRYRLIRRLGAGGMGVVYLAEHRLMQRPVALKVINPALVRNPVAVERFRLEVRAAAQLSHANIVAAHDAEQIGDLHFLAMEFIDGVNLAEFVAKRGPLAVEMACHFARQAAVGLQHAHLRGMVHRDIKPHNLMLTKRGVIKILDLGLARFAVQEGLAALQQSEGQSSLAVPGLTQQGSTIGTPEFMAPEQVQAAEDIDIRADIYSLGCTLYFLLAGSVPAARVATSTGMIVNRNLPEPAHSLGTMIRTKRNDVPDDVCQIIDRMTAHNRDDRYANPAQIAQALAPYCPNTLRTSAQSFDTKTIQVVPGYRGRQLHWKRSLLTAAALSVLAGGILLMSMLPGSGRLLRDPVIPDVADRKSIQITGSTDTPVAHEKSTPDAVAVMDTNGSRVASSPVGEATRDLPSKQDADRNIKAVQPRVLLVVTRNQFTYATVQPLRNTLAERGFAIKIASTITEPLIPAKADGATSINPDLLLTDVDPGEFSAVVFCGSSIPEFLGNTPGGKQARYLITTVQAKNGVLAAVGNGVAVLADAGLLDNRKATYHPTIQKLLEQHRVESCDAPVCISGQILTVRDSEAIPQFVDALETLLNKQPSPSRSSK